MTPQELNDIAVILQKHQFRIDSDDRFTFALSTNLIQAFWFETDGSHYLTAKKSIEVFGGDDVDPKSPAKIIRTESGKIILDAKDGDIEIRGNNIKLIATDALGGEIVLDSTKIIQLMAPNIRGQGENVIMAASGEFSAAGGVLSNHGEISNELTTGTDIIKASFFGKILSGILRFKTFFNSICGG